MRLLLDTNILLDVALQRQGLVEASQGIVTLCDGTHEAGVSWHSLSNAFYMITRHHRSTAPSWEYCHQLLAWATVVTVGQDDAAYAMTLDFNDLEDAMQAAAAVAFEASCIITRNTTDFTRSPVPALTPEQFLQRHHPELLG